MAFQNEIYYADSVAAGADVPPDAEAGFVLLADVVDLEGVVFEFESVACNGFAESGLDLYIQFVIRFHPSLS